ncbi:MAG: hypothetical protein HAW64_04670 [Alphaproteobacteria bacterium]|nr:hypothetical protein [Alphaproteobacteria bacterium]
MKTLWQTIGSYIKISYIKGGAIKIWRDSESWYGLFIFLSAFFLAALVLGAAPYDSNFNVVATTPITTDHWAGLYGAWASDIILQTIGAGVWVLLLPLAAWGLRRIKKQTLLLKLWHNLAAVLALLMASFGFSLYADYWGGALGHILYEGAILFVPHNTLALFAPLFMISALGFSLYASDGLKISGQISGILLKKSFMFFGRGLKFIGSFIGQKLIQRFTSQKTAIVKETPPRSKPSPSSIPEGERAIVPPASSAPPLTPPLTPSPAAAQKRKSTSSTSSTTDSQKAFESGQAFELPPLTLLAEPKIESKNENTTALSKETLEENARRLEEVLSDFGIRGRIATVRPGPVVTLYELELAAGIRTARVVGLADDIARSMAAVSCRVAPVSGTNLIGIELPNIHREGVALRTLLASDDFSGADNRGALALALGKDIGGAAVVADLSRMPHLLVAGTTGSGKSVGINSMILSLLYHLTPDECRMILVDPKMLEFSTYDGIPHLLTPVVTEPKKAVVALKWVVMEMENRYRKMAKVNVRSIDGFNERMREALRKGEVLTRKVQTGHDPETGTPIFEEEEITAEVLPYIVVVIDEMADLMMVAGKEIEVAVQRLAQMARAAGVHLITATQRPSVDVITGTIKANFPSRISFQVTSKIDSRTVLGEQGAEQLLGQGDMLYMEGGGKTRRVHGAFVSDVEVEQVVAFLKKQARPVYIDQVVQEPDEGDMAGVGNGSDNGGGDALYEQAVAIVVGDGRASTSYVQRKLQIGYNRAARLIEQMEERGVISPPNHAGKREIL